MENIGANPAYETASDNELIERIRLGDDQAFSILCGRYLPICRSLAGRYAQAALEMDDLLQEGMLGFIEATRRFNPHKQVPFESYARRCITSKMFSALDALTTDKRKANLGSLPFDSQEGTRELQAPSPDEVLIENEEFRHRSEQITSLLSKSENEALRLYLRGNTYAQIAARLEVPPKSVDNALQRVRRKLRAIIKP